VDLTFEETSETQFPDFSTFEKNENPEEPSMEPQAFQQNGRDFNLQQMIVDREVSYPSSEDETVAPSMVMKLEASPQYDDPLGQLLDSDCLEVFFNEIPATF